MSRAIYIIAFFHFTFLQSNYAQLPHGASAPNFTVQDINGGSFSLYANTSSGKGVVLDFFATWCGPCWSFHNSGILNRVVNELGAFSSVIAIEADSRTNAGCITNSGCNYSTLGNWATVPYQIANLTPSNGGSVKSQYQIAYYPTLYVISHDNRAFELRSKSYGILRSWLQESFFLDATPVVGNADCGGDGFIDLNRVKGYGAISYSWSNGATTEDLNNIGAGTYSVTVEDQNGYDKVFGPFIITGPPQALTLELDHKEDINCYGQQTGRAEVLGYGGNGGYQYNWSNGQTGSIATNLSAGLYRVSIFDSRGCMEEETVLITEPSLMTASGNEVDETCSLENGKIYISAKGGVPPYTFDIGNGPTTNSTFTDLKAGDYAVEVVDQNNCVTIYQAKIDHREGPMALAGVDLKMDCSVESLMISGSGSSGPSISYWWSTNDGEIIGDSIGLEIEIGAPGNYVLSVLDDNTSCVSSDTMTVANLQFYPEITFDSFEIITCDHPLEWMSVQSDSDVVYTWSTIEGNILSETDSSHIQVDESAHYYLEAMDTFSLCVSTDSVFIDADREEPDFSISGLFVQGCPDQELMLVVTDLDTSGTYEFLWRTVEGSVIGGSETLMVTIGAPGEYTVTVMDVRNGCESTLSVNIEQDWNVAMSDFTYVPDILEITFMDLSMGQGLSWSWDFGDDQTSQEQNPVHTYDDEGSFEVCLTVTNECGEDQMCKEIEVSENRGPLEITSVTITHVSCFEGSNGGIRLDVLGGYPPYDIVWSNGAQGNQILDLPAGSYSVEIKDDKDNVVTTDYVVEQPEQIVEENVTILHSDPSGNGSIDLLLKGGVPDYAYTWSNGLTTNPAQNLDPGEYWCDVVDQNDCQQRFGPYVVEISTSVQDVSLKTIRVHPNPAFDRVCLDLNAPAMERMEVYDITGSLQDVSASDKCIDITNLSAGTYLLKAWTVNGEPYIAKCIKTE